MIIGITIAAVAAAATVAYNVCFFIAEREKQEELKLAIYEAQSAIDSANDLYQNVYKVVNSRLELLKQSMTRMPIVVVKKLNQVLNLNVNDPDKAVQYAGWALGGTSALVSVADLVSIGLVFAKLAAADGVVAGIGAVSSGVMPLVAVAGFGLTLYDSITKLEKLNEAIGEVNKKKQDADRAVTEMKDSLDRLLKSLDLRVGKYQQLKDISDDWVNLAKNFDKHSTAFYFAIKAFAGGMSQAQVHCFLRSRDLPDLQDDILLLAKLIQENIVDMMCQGKTDQDVINFYAKENPHEGLRFVLDPYFVSTLRDLIN